MVDGAVKGLFVIGENPTVGSANGGYTAPRCATSTGSSSATS